MKAITTLALFAGLFVIAGCGETSTEAPTAETPATDSGAETTVVAAVNEVCPIMGGKVKDDGGRSEWNGKTVGFCCPGCIEKWEALPEDEKKTKLASSMESDEKGAALGTGSTQFVALTGKSGSCCTDAKETTGTCCSASDATTKSSCCSGSKTAATIAKAGCCASTAAAAKTGSCCAGSKDATTATVAFNANCPIMGSPVKAGGGSAEWSGKTVGFCCPGCVKKWDALSSDEKSQKLTDANPTDKVGA